MGNVRLCNAGSFWLVFKVVTSVSNNDQIQSLILGACRAPNKMPGIDKLIIVTT